MPSIPSPGQPPRGFSRRPQLGEIRKGIDRLGARDALQSLILERWLGEVKDEFQKRLIEVTPDIAEWWGRLQAIRSLPEVDALLAASALRHDLTLVTRNEADFAGLGIRVLNPFQGPAGTPESPRNHAPASCATWQGEVGELAGAAEMKGIHRGDGESAAALADEHFGQHGIRFDV